MQTNVGRADSVASRRREIAIVIATWVVFGTIMMALPRGPLRTGLYDFAWGSSGLYIMAGFFRRGQREARARATNWLLAAAGIPLALAGALHLAELSKWGDAVVPTAGFAILQRFPIPITLLALFLLPRDPAAPRALPRNLLDATSFAAACLFLFWTIALGAVVSQVGGLPWNALLAAFVGLALILGLIIYRAAAVPGRLRGPLGWTGAGFALGATGNTIGMVQLLHGASYRGNLGNVIQVAALLVWGLAARSRGSFADTAPPVEFPEESFVERLVVYLPAAISAIVTVVKLIGGEVLDTVGIAIGLVVLAAILGRQVLALQDVRDLSLTLERRVAERTRQLEQSQAALTRAQRMESLGRMASGLAHDFRNVLTVIKAYATMLRDNVAPQSPYRSDLDALTEAADRGTALVKQLLIFARPTNAEPRTIDPNEAMSTIARMLPGLGRGRIQARLVLEPGIASVFIDPSLLDQVLSNLIVNAVDAMPGAGTLTLETATIEVTERHSALQLTGKPGRYVQLVVQDTGIGIEEANLGRVFEPSFTTKPEGIGTGLGLATCYAIVTQVGGAITVQSQVGQGSRFEVLLPAGGNGERTAASQPNHTPDMSHSN